MFEKSPTSPREGFSLPLSERVLTWYLWLRNEHWSWPLWGVLLFSSFRCCGTPSSLFRGGGLEPCSVPCWQERSSYTLSFLFPSLVWGNLRYSCDGKICEWLTIYIWCFRCHNNPNMYHQICPIKLVVNLTSMFLLVFKSPGVSSGTRLFCHWSELAFWRIMLCLCVIVLHTPCWKPRSPPSRSAASHFLSLLFMIYGSGRG